jgi:hypothetical protein
MVLGNLRSEKDSRLYYSKLTKVLDFRQNCMASTSGQRYFVSHNYFDFYELAAHASYCRVLSVLYYVFIPSLPVLRAFSILTYPSLF